MGIHTDNARIREKIERLARLTGKDEEAALEEGLDRLLQSLPETDRLPPVAAAERKRRALEILAKIDRLPILPPEEQRPLPEWDEIGLPK